MHIGEPQSHTSGEDLAGIEIFRFDNRSEHEVLHRKNVIILKQSPTNRKAKQRRKQVRGGTTGKAKAFDRNNPHVRALLDSALDPRVVFRAVRDDQGRICDFIFAEANDSACTYNLLGREQLVGRRLLDLFPNVRQSGLFDMYRRIIETGENLELDDFRYQHEIHNEDRVFRIRAVPVGDELAYTWRDVTAESADRTDRTHSRSVNGAASDYRRPLTMERRKKRDLNREAAAQMHELELLTRRLIEIQEQQQQTVSRELHDNVAQVLAAVTNRITLARNSGAKLPAWLTHELYDLQENIDSALNDIRTLAREMRPSLLDHCGFAAALDKHAEDFRRRTGMDFELDLEPGAAAAFDNESLTHLFRLVQEALQNIEEHSGASLAWLRLRQNDGQLRLEIGDNGNSFTEERIVEAQRDGHLGLLGMRERTELLGGDFHLAAIPSQGTTIRAIIPYHRERERANDAEQHL